MSHLEKKPALIILSNFLSKDVSIEYNMSSIWTLWIDSLDMIIAESPKAIGRLYKHIKSRKEYEILRDYKTKRDVRKRIDEIVEKNQRVGILSDSGHACIADPGSIWVDCAHCGGCDVYVAPGYTSFIGALALSGFSSQRYQFHGYLPYLEKKRIDYLKELYRDARRGITQIVIETPYRNEQMIKDIKNTCPEGLRVCIAENVIGSKQQVTRHVYPFNNMNVHKEPTTFLFSQ